MEKSVLNGDLTKCNNIGKVLIAKLKTVGIENKGQLVTEGSEVVFLKLLAKDPTICINHLYALEGAVHNVRWHDLPELKKKKLKEFYNKVK